MMAGKIINYFDTTAFDESIGVLKKKTQKFFK